VPGNRHAGFGKRPGETHRWQHRQGAPGRLRLTMATIELWRAGHHRLGTGQWKAWLSFTLGIGLSLCANIASVPELNAFSIAVAACPPLALLLSVELLNQALKRHRAGAVSTTVHETDEAGSAQPHSTAPGEASPSPEMSEKTEDVPAPSTATNTAPSRKRPRRHYT
jgi:hypothetical protein